MAPHKANTEGDTIGIYLQGKLFACGFWAPTPADLNRIRQEIDIDGESYRTILNDKSFRSVWGELDMTQLKHPKRYTKDHPQIDLLRFAYIFTINYPDKDICQPDFIERADIALQAVRPFVTI